MSLVIVVVVASVAGLAATWFVKGTRDAGIGAASPSLAVSAYFLEGPLGGPFVGEGIAANLYGCGNDRKLHEQAVDLVSSAQRGEEPGKVAFDRVLEMPAADETTVDGDRATVTTMAQWQYSNIDRQGATSWMWYALAAQPWTFKLESDNGWRVCEVIAPDPCAPEARNPWCGPIQPTATAPPPSKREWDTRVGWRCLPDTPQHFRRNDCAAPPPDWSPPGPYDCAPAYPDVMRDDKKCAALGW